MLFNQNNRLAIRGIILTSLLMLAGCGSSAALEGLVSADPELKDKAEQTASTDKSRSPQKISPVRNREETSSRSRTEPEATDNVRNDNTRQNDAAVEQEAPQAVSQVSNLPFSFPGSFPVYPQAELQEVESVDDNSGRLIWNTTDNRKAVADYYQAELSANDWDVIKPFTIDPKQKIARAIAVKDDLRVELSLMRSAADTKSNEQNTKLLVVYHPVGEDIPRSSISQAIDSSEPETNSSDSNVRSQPEEARQQADEPIPQSYADSSDDNFTDLNEVPEQLQQPLKSVAALGILTPYTGESNVELAKFAPDRAITRGEYARWLVAANNRYFSDNPGKKIYVASKTNQPAFKDVGPNHPDFAAIQSLAEAGLIPSRLTEDSTNLLFRPDAPLTREDLITWKVPLDTRQSLPQATIEAIEESWGFQDAANIDSSAVRALYADFQNGDRSNIRRIFGYTTLFQPKKPVTRAEAGASLGYFGFQGDGISAREVLESESAADS